MKSLTVSELSKGDILTNTNHGFDIEIVEIGKKIHVISTLKLAKK